jgi:CRISPR-associated protein Csb2
MTRLVISASPLLDRWSVTASDSRGRSSWPPSPDTLFSALVASAASLGNARHPALYWLEGLGNPAIETDLGAPRVDGVKTYDPVADRTLWEPKSRQPREHNSVGHPGPVAWSWETDAKEHLPSLQKIAQNVTYIGSSRGPVIANASISERALVRGALVPGLGRRKYLIRGIYPGRLDELETAFQCSERPRPTQEVGYTVIGEQQLARRWEQVIPLNRVTGQALHIGHAVPLAEALRNAITQCIPNGAPGTLTGHAQDGAQLAADHMAIMPMPRVDDDYADGKLFGAALVLPAGIGDAEYQTLIGGLGRWLSSGGIVEVGPVRWTMGIAQGARPYSLREDRYKREARTWATITPVVFDRHPRRTLSLSDVVSRMCRDVDLPKPDRVEAMRHGPVNGTTECREYSIGGRSYLRNHFTSHLRLSWTHPVQGPVLLGRGQYFGLGVLIPSREVS